MALDAPHLVSCLIESTIKPLFKKGTLNFRAITWYNEDDAFDVWPQFAVAASILDEQVAADGEGALKAFGEATGKSFEWLKP